MEPDTATESEDESALPPPSKKQMLKFGRTIEGTATVVEVRARYLLHDMRRAEPAAPPRLRCFLRNCVPAGGGAGHGRRGSCINLLNPAARPPAAGPAGPPSPFLSPSLAPQPALPSPSPARCVSVAEFSSATNSLLHTHTHAHPTHPPHPTPGRRFKRHIRRGGRGGGGGRARARAQTHAYARAAVQAPQEARRRQEAPPGKTNPPTHPRPLPSSCRPARTGWRLSPPYAR